MTGACELHARTGGFVLLGFVALVVWFITPLFLEWELRRAVWWWLLPPISVAVAMIACGAS